MYVATSQRVIIFPMVANYKSLCLPADHPGEGGKEGIKGKRNIFHPSFQIFLEKPFSCGLLVRLSNFDQ